MQSSEKMENIITDLDYNVKFSYMGAPRSFPEHWHEFAEFIIATDNNGSYSVGNEQYHLDTGDLLLIWPGEMHSNISVTSNSSLLLQFGDNFIYNCHDLMINYRHFKTYHKIGREDMTELNEILTYHMKEAYHIFKSHDPFTETACTIQIYSMLMALGKYIYNNINTSQITSNCSSQNYIKIQNACTYISQNCEKDLSQKDISPNGFYLHKFVLLSGCHSPGIYPALLPRPEPQAAIFLYHRYCSGRNQIHHLSCSPTYSGRACIIHCQVLHKLIYL